MSIFGFLLVVNVRFREWQYPRIQSLSQRNHQLDGPIVLLRDSSELLHGSLLVDLVSVSSSATLLGKAICRSLSRLRRESLFQLNSGHPHPRHINLRQICPSISNIYSQTRLQPKIGVLLSGLKRAARWPRSSRFGAAFSISSSRDTAIGSIRWCNVPRLPQRLALHLEWRHGSAPCSPGSQESKNKFHPAISSHPGPRPFPVQHHS